MPASPLETLPFVGREQSVSLCLDLVATQRGVIVAGPAGVGKTRVAQHLADVLDESRGEPVIRLRLTSSGTIPIATLKSLGACVEPQVVVIDDVHLLDDDAAALLHHIVANEHIVLIATLRTGEPASPAVTAMWKDDFVERIDLSDLSRADVNQLLDEMLGGPIDAPSRLILWKSTRGSPLLIRELLRSALDDESLRRVEGVWQIGQLPRSVRLDELMAVRLDALSSDALHVVELVALGEPLGWSLLSAATGIDPIAEAEQANIIEVVRDLRRTEVRLNHPLFRDLVERRLGIAAAAQRSLELLAMAEPAQMRRENDIVRTATWQLRGGGVDVSADMVLAARRALYDNKMWLAVEFATAAQAGTPTDAALVMGEALIDLGEPARAEEVLRTLPPRSADADLALVAMQRAIALFWGLGDAAAADAVLVAAVDELPPGDWRDEVLAERAVLVANQGDVVAAMALVEPLLEKHSSGRTFVTASIAAGLALALTGRSLDAIEVAQRAFMERTALGEQPTLTDSGIFVVTQTLAMTEAGQLVGAAELSDMAYSASVEEGIRVGQAWFAMIHGRVNMVTGHLAEAHRLFVEAAGCFARLHNQGPQRWSMAGVVITAALRGDAVEVERSWVELQQIPDHPAQLMNADVHRAEAWVHASRGDRGRAVALLREVARDTFQTGAVAACTSALHDIVRLGGTIEPVEADRGGGQQGELGPAQHRLLLGAAHSSAIDVDAAATLFTELGSGLFAAEAAAIAADLHERDGARRAAARCRRQSATAQSELGEDWLLTLDRSLRPAVLTDREVEITELAADGATNREIAEQLVVSVRTIENHLQRVYNKLGISGRRELADVIGRVKS